MVEKTADKPDEQNKPEDLEEREEVLEISKPNRWQEWNFHSNRNEKIFLNVHNRRQIKQTDMTAGMTQY